MRVIHTCLRYPPALGGAENYIADFVEHTQAIPGISTRILTSKMKTHGPISELSPSALRNDNPNIHRLHHVRTPFISYPRLQALPHYLEHHKPDIIHAYGFWYQPADVAARYAQKNKIPLILHPIFYETKVRQKKIWQLYKKTIGKHTFEAATVVVVISPFEQNLIRQSGLPVKRFELIPPGINIHELNSQQPNFYKQQGISGKIIFSAARLSREKGIQDILYILPKILEHHPDIQYVIAGEDFGALSSLRKVARENHITNHVHFIGKVNRFNYVSALQHADIFLHPSHYEAFGIVIAEALAAKTPVIARDTSAIPFVAPPNQASLLFSSRDDLVKKLLLLLGNPNLRHKLATFGFEHVRSHFNWSTNLKKITDLYQELKPIHDKIG